MTDMESQIRAIALRAPGESLDERVLGLLQSDHVSSVDYPLESRNSMNCLKPNSDFRRGLLTLSLGGMMAALVVGFIVGNSLPSIWQGSQFSSSGLATGSEFTSGHSHASGLPFEFPQLDERDLGGGPMLSHLPAQIVEAQQNLQMPGSQIVESTRETARAGAIIWERENGELFNMATHVSDRRFNMCRECHRVGG